MNARFPACFVFFVLLCGAAWADDVDDSIIQGRTAYREGDLSSAIGKLEFALERLRQQNSQRLIAFLPAPLPGWEAMDSRAGIPSGVFSGKYSAAEREYFNQAGLVSVRIEMDSPAISSLNMLASNPAYAESTGATVKSLEGYKAIVHYDSETRDGDISLLVENRFVVTVEGDGVSLEELEAYLAGVGFEQLPGRAP